MLLFVPENTKRPTTIVAGCYINSIPPAAYGDGHVAPSYVLLKRSGKRTSLLEEPDVVHARFEHGLALDAHAKSKYQIAGS